MSLLSVFRDVIFFTLISFTIMHGHNQYFNIFHQSNTHLQTLDNIKHIFPYPPTSDNIFPVFMNLPILII